MFFDTKSSTKKNHIIVNMHVVVHQNKSSSCQYACCHSTKQIIKLPICILSFNIVQQNKSQKCRLHVFSFNKKVSNACSRSKTISQQCQMRVVAQQNKSPNLSICMLSSKHTHHKLVNMHVVVSEKNKLPTSHCHPLIKSNQFV